MVRSRSAGHLLEEDLGDEDEVVAVRARTAEAHMVSLGRPGHRYSDELLCVGSAAHRGCVVYDHRQCAERPGNVARTLWHLTVAGNRAVSGVFPHTPDTSARPPRGTALLCVSLSTQGSLSWMTAHMCGWTRLVWALTTAGVDGIPLPLSPGGARFPGWLIPGQRGVP